MNDDTSSTNRAISLRLSVILVILIAISILVFSQILKASLGVALGLTWLVVYLFCLAIKYDWSIVQKGAFDAIRNGMVAILILLAVGMLIGTWIQCGAIPTIITYGLLLVSPSVFLPAAMLLCSLLSLATGTSYGSAASGGLAMMAVGLSMGFPAGMIAGAVLCGSLFGDKMSPFSDTTNLAPAMAGTDIFTHVKMMMWNTIPAWIITMILFYFIGIQYTSSATYNPTEIQNCIDGLAANFQIGLVTLVPIVIVIVLLLFRQPAIPVLMIGAVAGGVMAVLLQDASLASVLKSMNSGFSIKSGNFLIDKLLNRGGMMSMDGVVWIMIFGMGLGGMLESMGALQNFLNLMVRRITNAFSLTAATYIICYFCGAIFGTQNMTLVAAGKLLAPFYREKGYAPEFLSKNLEDAGTLGGVFFPWHTNSAYFCGVLAVTYIEYIPFVFMCFLAPIISLIYAAVHFKVPRIDPVSGEYVVCEKGKGNR
jgi:NhaC family Na+:H+ antiporter